VGTFSISWLSTSLGSVITFLDIRNSEVNVNIFKLISEAILESWDLWLVLAGIGAAIWLGWWADQKELTTASK
jgi:hypothetical protein